jgi:arylsulfatase A-like enzyme
MRPRYICFALFAMLTLEGIGAKVGAATPTLPNIVIILADDLGYGDLGCYGNTVQQTPHLDRLAAEGVRFTDFYMTSSICTPSRVALMTGRYPVRAGLSALLWPTDKAGLPVSEITIAEALKARGYATACIGKWHLGHSQPEQLPMGHGFDYWYGMPYPNDMDARHPIAKQRKEAWPPLPLQRGTTLLEEGTDVNLLTQKYHAEAVQFIREKRNRPFFLYLAHAAPHTYLGASPGFRGKSKNGLFGDMIEEMDWSMGQVTATLRELGLEKNTLVFFTSDNGASVRKGERPEVDQLMHPDGTYGSNAPLRGGKQDTFEGGVRVPGIAWWPGVIAPRQVVHEPAIALDLFPTVLELAGAPLSADRVIDGRTLVPVLRGSGRREVTDFYFGSSMLTACRSGRWKLQLVRQPGQAWNARPTGALLFDLEADVGEKTDLAARHPELVTRLHVQLNGFEQSLRKH